MWIDFQVCGLRQEKSSNMLSIQMPFINAARTLSHALNYSSPSSLYFYDLQSH